MPGMDQSMRTRSVGPKRRVGLLHHRQGLLAARGRLGLDACLPEHRNGVLQLDGVVVDHQDAKRAHVDCGRRAPALEGSEYQGYRHVEAKATVLLGADVC